MILSLKRPLRHADKMLTSVEKRAWLASGQQCIDLWKHWACKEAAYKIYLKKGGERKLNPKQFVVGWKGNKIHVTNLYHDEHYSVNLSHHKHFVHAVLWEGEVKVKSKVFSLSQTDPDQQSRDVRNSICHFLDAPTSQITMNDQRIPILAGWDISLSHCGDWGAWSAVKL